MQTAHTEDYRRGFAFYSLRSAIFYKRHKFLKEGASEAICNRLYGQARYLFFNF
jgi:hypothetical protein